jgi:predicted dehydrogenase
MNPKQFNVLLIGCGNMAAGFDLTNQASVPARTHAAGFARHNGFKLTACIDPDVERRSGTAEKWNIPVHCESVEQLHDSDLCFDVVSICSPTHLHREHIEAAVVMHPKVIFCEKPLTASLQDTQYAIELCEAHNVTLAVNYSRNWDPSITDLMRQIRQNRWGDLRSVVAHYNKGILNNGGHMVGLLLQLLGGLQIVSVRNIHFDLSQEDPTVAALLFSDDNIPVYLNPTHAADYALFELELFFSRGVIRMLDGGLNWQIQIPVAHEQYQGYNALSLPSRQAGNYSSAMSLAVENIYEHLTSNRPIACSGQDAIAIQKICEAIRVTATH